jgi:hypothetical protein
MTSVASYVYNGYSVVFVGTKSGKLKKVRVCELGCRDIIQLLSAEGPFWKVAVGGDLSAGNSLFS